METQKPECTLLIGRTVLEPTFEKKKENTKPNLK